MCGIAGIVAQGTGAPVEPEEIRTMVGMLLHRGPDEQGMYIDSHAGLGHARLSIIDLQSGSQPICNEDRTVWIVYNGEIFNYQELRHTLLQRGHTFTTRTDTEVLLHLYEDKGARCVDELNGQFAFAIWDGKRRELFLARDRLGILPLYYSSLNGRFMFASEMKAILAVSESSRNLDEVALDQTFTFWTTLPGRTPFKGIEELQPGHSIRVSGADIHRSRYWSIPYIPPSQRPWQSIERWESRIRELLFDAVRIRLQADVPVGAYLSGGIDSSGLCALISRNFPNTLCTFGIGFEHTDYDETPEQNLVVSHLGVDHNARTAANEEIGRWFPDVIRHCERPLLRTAPTPLFLLSERVRQKGYKVVVTGEGADEVFGGYNIFRESLIRRFWARQPQSKIRSALAHRLYPHLFRTDSARTAFASFLRQGLEHIHDPLYSHLPRWNNMSRIKSLFSPQFRSGLGSYNALEELRSSLPEKFSRRDLLDRAQYLEMTLFMSNYLLSSQGDRMAMAHGVEMRLPYLDHRIVEMMAEVPACWKILGINAKHLLKRVYRDTLPDSILTREKYPYRAPIKESLFGSENPRIQATISESAIRDSGIFDPQKLTSLISRAQSGSPLSETDSMAISGIISTQLIGQFYLQNTVCPQHSDFQFHVYVDARAAG